MPGRNLLITTLAIFYDIFYDIYEGKSRKIVLLCRKNLKIVLLYQWIARKRLEWGSGGRRFKSSHPDQIFNDFKWLSCTLKYQF